MFKQLLVPLDGSQLAEAALPIACEVASKFDSEITLLRVVTSPVIFLEPTAYASELLMTMKEQSRGEAIDYLRRHKESLSRQGYLVHTQLIENESPAEAILITVEEQDMDMVVMSTHGRGGVTRWVYGSVADKVLRHSDIPVLLIRTQKAKMPAT